MPDDRVREQLVATFCLAVLVGIAFFGAYAGHSTQETAKELETEFWPPFLGYRLKVTDTLVAAFTGGLFLATFALWLATRRLVKGAENTSERQLRAYVFPEGVSLEKTEKPEGVWIVLHAKYKNFGQTPAYNFASSSEITISPRNPYSEIEQSKKRHTVIGAGDNTNIMPDEGPFSSDDINAVLTERKFIYACLRIDYVDVFDIERTSTFYFRNGRRVPGDPDKWAVENAGRSESGP